MTPTTGPAPWRVLLAASSAPAWRAHPWRHGVALLAVALGVALAWSVHLVNVSALAEFAHAVHVVQGAPDASLRCVDRAGCDDAVFDAVAAADGVRSAAPVVDLDTVALRAGGQRVAVRVLGIDALVHGPLAPALRPQVADGEPRLAFLDPDVVFVNAALRARLDGPPGAPLVLQHGLTTATLRRAGSAAEGGPPLAVMDIAGAQAHFARVGRIDRIDLRLAPGATPPAPPAGWRLAEAHEDTARVSNLSRAYRVNLTVLALVALFVGAFLVFSVLALAVAQRVPSYALLGVLGASATDLKRLVRVESLCIGLAGSLLGVALGTALAALALRWLGGDLGGGYFGGGAPSLAWSWPAAAVVAAIGVVAALCAGELPARRAERLAPAQALKGLGGAPPARPPAAVAPGLLGAGALLACAPAIGGVPVAAYASVALLLLGGVALVPTAVSALRHVPLARRCPLALLALAHARHDAAGAAVAMAGVVASVALAVALTVMVASFRASVTDWLAEVLPADLYARAPAGAASGDAASFSPTRVDAARAVPGVARIDAARTRALTLRPEQPAVSLLARALTDAPRQLPLVGAPVPVAAGATVVYVSEAMVALHGALPGSTIVLPGVGEARVAGVWRDYARQFGSVVIDLDTYRRLTGDDRLNELAVWLQPGAATAEVQRGIEHALAGDDGRGSVEFATTAQLRERSLAIFDRSFAVTYYLQALAVGIGLFGIAASFSAQALARRREFGLLAHLGLRRRQIVGIVAGEGAAWSAVGALLGLVLGLAVALVLVHVVNPQSFHWTMSLTVPAPRLVLLVLAVVAAGALAAAVGARAAASVASVRAVKEDW